MEETDRETELENVATAYFLESTVAKLEEEQKRVARKEPKAPGKPGKPFLQTMQAKKLSYPPVAVPTPKATYPKFWKYAAWVFGILTFGGSAFMLALLFFTPLSSVGFFLQFASAPLCLACILIGYYIKGSAGRRAEAEAERIRNSAEYKRKCAEVDEHNRKQQEELDAQARKNFEASTRYYENAALPNYEKALEKYKTEIHPAWVREREKLQNAIVETKATLQEVYEQNIIPSKYRNLSALAFIASFMGTSNYDLKFAIERYDKEIDQLIARQQLNVSKAMAVLAGRVLREQQSANYLQAQAIDYLTEGNRLLKHTRNWAAASTALQAVDIIADWRRAKRR